MRVTDMAPGQQAISGVEENGIAQFVTATADSKGMAYVVYEIALNKNSRDYEIVDVRLYRDPLFIDALCGDLEPMGAAPLRPYDPREGIK